MSLPLRREAAEPIVIAPVLTILAERPARRVGLSRAQRLRVGAAAVALGGILALAGVGAGQIAAAFRAPAGLRLVTSPVSSARASLGSAEAVRRLGFVSVSGTVVSHNPAALPGVEAVVELLDSKNRTVQVESAMVAFDPLPAGEAAPFRVEISDVAAAVGYRVRFRQVDGLCLN